MGDPDQPRPQRPAVGLAPGPVEVPVGLQEGLLGEVLGVVVVADPVVGVGVDVAQVGPVEVLEGAVQLRLRRRRQLGRLDVLLWAAHRPSLDGRQPRSGRPPAPARPGAGRRPSPRRRSRRGSAPRGPRAPRRRRPAAATASASSGTVSRPSEAWPISAGISSAGVPVPSSSPARRLRPVGRHHRRGQVADPGQPGEGLELGAVRDRVVDALAPDLGGGDPGGVQPVRLGRGGGQRGGVLGGARHLDPDHVGGALADQAGAVEDLAELGAQVGVGGAEDQRGGAGDRLARRGPGRRGRRSPAPAPARRRTRTGSWPCGAIRPLVSSRIEERSPTRSAIAPTACGQRLRGDREADQVEAGELDLGRRARRRSTPAARTPGR